MHVQIHKLNPTIQYNYNALIKILKHEFYRIYTCVCASSIYINEEEGKQNYTIVSTSSKLKYTVYFYSGR